MNANVTTFALALASNLNARHYLAWALQRIQTLGEIRCSQVFEIPCRDAVGADYLNMACLVDTPCHFAFIQQYLKELEQQAGRVRPSHQVSLDIDIIAWQQNNKWHFNEKKMPFAVDVKIPMYELLPYQDFKVTHTYDYQTITLKSDHHA